MSRASPPPPEPIKSLKPPRASRLSSTGSNGNREFSWPGKLNPNGIPAQSPRVARHELPWVGRRKMFQPQRGCAEHPPDEAATPLGLTPIPSRFPRVARASQPLAGGHNPFGIAKPAIASDLPWLQPIQSVNSLDKSAPPLTGGSPP